MAMQLIRNRGRVARVQSPPPPAPPKKKVKCHGPCGCRKGPVCFRPSDLRSKYPMCRECRKTYGPTPSRRRLPAELPWRGSARRLFISAIVEGRAV